MREARRRKVLSVSKAMNLRYNINGMCWFCYGITKCIEPSKIINLLAVVFMSVALFSSCKIMFSKKEADDEMSMKHSDMAAYDVLVTIILIILTLILCSLCIDIATSIMGDTDMFNFKIPFIQFSFNGILSIIFGLISIMYGRAFSRHEKDGY